MFLPRHLPTQSPPFRLTIPLSSACFCASRLFDVERLNSVQDSNIELHCADTIVMRIHRTTGKADHSSIGRAITTKTNRIKKIAQL